MIYVFCMLFLFNVMLVLRKYLLPALSTLAPKINTLEHDELLTLCDKFDYQHDDGTCHGFTLTWAQEAALGLEQQFYERLNLIKREKEILPDKTNAIAEKIKSKQTLSKKETRLNEIKPFLEALCLAQSPERYTEFYTQTIQQSDINIIYKMIQVNLIENKEVKKLFGKTLSMASEKEVNNFLNILNQILTIKNQVAVLCSSEEHTVGFKKHKNNLWHFIDINHLYEQSKEYPHQKLTSKELSSTLYSTLFETSEQLVFHCSFIAKPDQGKLTQQLKSLANIFPVTKDNIPIFNCRGQTSLTLGMQNDDGDTVRKILRLHKKSSIVTDYELKTAFFYAASCNRLDMMKQLMKIQNIDINNPCIQDDVPLGVACGYSNENIVQFLLGVPDINVNLKNDKGMTPLMIACKSSLTKNNPKLFEILLASGADHTLTNEDEETAYDIAKRKNNQAALTALASHSIKSSPDLPPSQPSKTKAISAPNTSFFFNKPNKSLPQSLESATHSLQL